MKSQRHYSFSFFEEINGLIDFIFVGSKFVVMLPSKNVAKSEIKIFVYTSNRSSPYLTIFKKTLLPSRALE